MTKQDKLKELFYYDKEGGLFIRKVSKGNTKDGDVAGSKDSKGYLRVLFDGRREKIHRLAFLYVTGSMPSNHVDHRNGIKSDNAWTNLRDVTNEVNCSNRSKHNKNNKESILGVHSHKNKYRAKFKGVCLGLYNTPDEASEAYTEARGLYEGSL